jgi:hypothetical protein
VSASQLKESNIDACRAADGRTYSQLLPGLDRGMWFEVDVVVRGSVYRKIEKPPIPPRHSEISDSHLVMETRYCIVGYGNTDGIILGDKLFDPSDLAAACSFFTLPTSKSILSSKLAILAYLPKRLSFPTKEIYLSTRLPQLANRTGLKAIH